MRDLLTLLSRGSERWDALQRRPAWRLGGVVVGLVGVGIGMQWPVPEGLTPEGWTTLWVAVLMAGWGSWIR